MTVVEALGMATIGRSEAHAATTALVPQPDHATQTPSPAPAARPGDLVLDDVTARVGRALASGTAIPALFVDGSLNCRWASESIVDLTGYRSTDLLERPALDFVHPADVPSLIDVLASELIAPRPYVSNADPARRALRRLRVATVDGGWVACDMAATNLLDDPSVRGFLIMLVPAAEQFHLDEAHRALVDNRPLSEVAAHAAAMLMSLMPEVTVAYVADAPTSARFPVDPHRPSSGAFLITGLSDDVTTWASQVIDGALALVRLAIRRDAAAEVLRRAATTDALTGLANRRALTARLEELSSDPAPRSVGFIFIDLDRFKAINDSLGHDVGDDVLRKVGEVLTRLAPIEAMALRLGGDEFGVLVDDAGSRSELDALAERLRSAAAEVVAATGVIPSAGASAGSAFCADPTELADLADLIGRSDAALLRAKRAGRERTESSGASAE